MSAASQEIILKNVRSCYSSKREASFFSIPEFTLEKGAQLALLGKSGSGKSTLLHLIAGLIPVKAGRARVCGEELMGMKEHARDLVRREHIGLVFQTYQLLDEFTVIENVLMGSFFSGVKKEAEGEAKTLLSKVGLENYASRFPSELSVGQRQRVAIVRALIKRPALILADEPTGALDRETGYQVSALLKDLAKEQGSSMIFVTHDEELASTFPSQAQVTDLIRWEKGDPV